MLIGGEWVDTKHARHFACCDPFTEAQWGRVPLADADDVDAAVRAARAAFEGGEWPRLLAADRARLLLRLADLIDRDVEHLARQQVFENGKLITEMRAVTAALAADCRFVAGLAEVHGGDTVPSTRPNFTTYVLREPIGVVAAITPWNTPLTLLGWKLFPALAAGNTVVIKPSEVTPTSTLMLASLAVEAGFPRGAINVVTGYGEPAGTALVRHPHVEKIAFTGSTSTGQRIAVEAAKRSAAVSLEMGGKSANIIFADADIDNAVNGVMAGVFAATGQSCVAGSRVLVEASVYDRVAELLVERARKMIIGDPLDPATQLGPLASRAQLEKVTQYFEIARTEGLELLTGGRQIERTGFFVEPTVYGNVPNDCRIAQEEIFGPVVALMPFRAEEEAVRIANATRYGLAAAAWTEDYRRQQRLIAQLRAGTVWINNYRIVGHTLPFGGYKQSGVGREMGRRALEAYSETKSVWIDIGNRVAFPVGKGKDE
jgi:aldehyde dehydrogenase (NAD+)